MHDFVFSLLCHLRKCTLWKSFFHRTVTYNEDGGRVSFHERSDNVLMTGKPQIDIVKLDSSLLYIGNIQDTMFR